MYGIYIAVERSVDPDHAACLMGVQECEGVPSVLTASWALSHGDKVVAKPSEDMHPGRLLLDDPSIVLREVGGFYVQDGTHYSLDLDILTDASRLDGGHPRLWIVEVFERKYQSTLGTLVFWGLVAACLGTMVFLLSWMAWRRRRRWEQRVCFTWAGRPTAPLQIDRRGPLVASQEEHHPKSKFLALLSAGYWRSRSAASVRFTEAQTGRQYFQWAQKLPLRPALTGFSPPTFAVFLAFFIGIQVLLQLVVMMGDHIPSQGLTVFLVKAGTLATKPETLFKIQPLVVHVKQSDYRKPPLYFLNGRQISLAELAPILKQEFSRRRTADWVVYVEGDEVASFETVANAIDIIRGLGGKVYLLTSKSERPE
jgi:biopolymer transport protein ExbD